MIASTNRSRVWIAVLTAMFGLGVSSAVLGHQGLLSLQKDPKQWVMPNGNYSGWNYSGLDIGDWEAQITLTEVNGQVIGNIPTTVILWASLSVFLGVRVIPLANRQTKERTKRALKQSKIHCGSANT